MQGGEEQEELKGTHLRGSLGAGAGALLPRLGWTLTLYLLACGQVQGVLGKRPGGSRLAMMGTRGRLGAAATHQEVQKDF